VVGSGRGSTSARLGFPACDLFFPLSLFFLAWKIKRIGKNKGQ